MATTSHTLGPWHVGRRTIESPAGTICETYSHMGIEEANANERLIASAPDLLAALIAFRDGGPQGGQNFAEWHESYRPAIELARAAIARATGNTL